MASEFEELRINVKVDQPKAAENARQLQDAFRSITDVQHAERFEKLGRQFRLNETQIKQLGEAIVRPASMFEAFAMGFGRGGAILLALDASIKIAKAAFSTFTDAAGRQIEISNAAKRMGDIHAAQLDANVRLMERESITRGNAISMMEKFAERRDAFLQAHSEFRQSILKDVEGPFVDVVNRHFFELQQAPDVTTMMNLVRRFADEIESYYRERGHPERAALEKRKYLERWFGLPDIARLATDFVKVSKEAEDAWDRNQKVAEEFNRVTTDIRDNFGKIVSSVLTQVMDEMGIGSVLRAANYILESGAQQHEELGGMSPEERERFIQQKIDEGDAAWREMLRDLLRSGFGVKQESEAEKQQRLERQRQILPPSPPPLFQRQNLFDDFNDNQSELLVEEKRLVQNLAFLNALLSAGGGGIGGGGGSSLALSTKTPNLYGKPGGPSGTVNNDLSESEFNRLMKGGKFEGQYQTVVNTAHANNIPASLMASILAFETGYGKSRAVSDYNNPAGLMGGGKGNKEFMKFNTIEEGIAKAGEVQSRIYQQGGQTVAGMGAIYAPVGKGGKSVANDPHGTNKQWPASVGNLQKKFQEYTGPEEGIGKGFRVQPTEMTQAQVSDDSRYTGPEEGIGKGFRQDSFQTASGLDLIKSRPQHGGASGPSIDYVDSANWLDPRRIQRALEKVKPGSEEEWELRKAQALSIPGLPPKFKSPGYSEFENPQVPEGYGPGSGLPPEGRIEETVRSLGKRPRSTDEDVKKLEEMYSGPWRDRKLNRDMPISLDRDVDITKGRRAMDRDMGDELDVSGKLNVKVDAPAGTEVKATGDGMFKNGISLDRSLPAVM